MYQETVLGVVVTLADIRGYFQDSKNVDLMGSLSKMKPKDLVVARDGKRETLEPAKLVPGIICELTTGMALPADLRVIQCTPDMKSRTRSSATGSRATRRRPRAPTCAASARSS